MIYTVYDKAGNIRTVRCAESAIKKQLRLGESYIEGQIDQRKYKVVDGIKTELSQAEKDILFPNENALDEDQPAFILQKDWDAVIRRLDALENG